MVDFTANVYKELHDTEEESAGVYFYNDITLNQIIYVKIIYNPLELMAHREQVINQLNALNENVQEVLDILQDPEVLATVKQDKMHSHEVLSERFGVSTMHLSLIYLVYLYN
jgi:translation initiation factor 3 subunit E